VALAKKLLELVLVGE